ncbi:MAG: homoserine O-acetyltransferase MetX [Ilumatobacteraceae bacterium]|jgi:homoserine O-acetyltransferase
MYTPYHGDGPYPASGAWTPDQPAGERQFFTFATDRPFSLECGERLSDVTIAYETWGTLNADASNAVLVCHAWTGDSHASGPAGTGHPTPGWWEGVVGAGHAIDPERYFIVCANVLGGCQGSTGPASPHPEDGRPYGLRFPVVTIRDMVRAQAHLADHLGVERWQAVVGGSMGGMQALEWAIMFPSRVGALLAIATSAEASAQQIAWGAIGRRALWMDPNYRGGDYYDAGPDGGPWRGLAIARQIAQVTFRSDTKFNEKFGRNLARDNVFEHGIDLFSVFDVEGYLDYHGDKLVRRFDANSYLYIGKAMDLHDVGRGRGGPEKALARVTAPTLTVSIDSDILYPKYQQEFIQASLSNGDARNTHVEVSSPEGHDGFLIETRAIGNGIREFFATL